MKSGWIIELIRRFEIVRLFKKIIEGEWWSEEVFNMVIGMRVLLIMVMNINGIFMV